MSKKSGQQTAKRRNLAVLVFCDNTAYVTAVPPQHKSIKNSGLKIDTRSGTWSANDEYSNHQRTHKIGEGRYITHRGPEFVIGVFDRSKINHISSMLHAAVESQRDYRHAD